jgi:hypothetical protein
MKMEQTECSEMSAYKIQTPGNYTEEIIQHSEHGKSLKSRMYEMLNFTYDSDVSPEHKFQNEFSFIRGSRGVMTGKNEMNVLFAEIEE